MSDFTHKICLDGREVKLGDRLYCLCRGWAEVIEFVSGKNYALRTSESCYTIDGRYITTGPRTLYWDEIKFDIPKPPKRKVTKYKLLLANLKDPNEFIVTNDYYVDVSSFKGCVYEAVSTIPRSAKEFDE